MSLLLDPPEAASPGPQTFAQPGVAVGEVAADAVESSAPMAAPAIAAPGIRRIASGPLLAIAIVSVLAGATLFVSGWSLGRAAATTPGTPNSDADEFQAFWDAYGAVTQRYAGGLVDRKTLVEGAIKGLIDSLGDPYSQYLTSQQYRDNLRGLSGQFEGIGATLSTRGSNGLVSTCSPLGPDCHLAIQVPLDGSPALKAGLSAGDVVEAVDNKAVDGLTIDEARNLIRGPRDTNVVLRIVRGRGLPFDVHLTRAVIVQQEVVTRELAGGTVGYVKLTGFSEQSADQFATAIKADVDAGRRKIIVDLRGNPGGFVTTAQKIASQFIASGVLFWQEDASGSMSETDALPGGAATDPGVRLVVLIDGGSASASEIVAASLHDRGRATLVGEKSFGKGTVQQWLPLEADHGGFRLTIAKWLTPKQVWIHGKGIQPDIVVQASDPATSKDAILDKALEILDVTASTDRLAA